MKELPERVDGTGMLSVKEVACRLQVSANTVYGLAAPGGPIPCYRIGRRILFMEEDLQAYLASCRFTQANLDMSLRSAPIPMLVVRPVESELERIFRQHGLKPKLNPQPNRR